MDGGAGYSLMCPGRCRAARLALPLADRSSPVSLQPDEECHADFAGLDHGLPIRRNGALVSASRSNRSAAALAPPS